MRTAADAKTPGQRARNDAVHRARVDRAIGQIGSDRVRGVVADLGTADGADALVRAVPDTDILVNNLGIYGARDFFSLTDDGWARIAEVNVMSGIRLARRYAPAMKARGWGRIQFVSSESALNIPTETVHYGVSKAAVQAVSRGLAKILAGSGVTVNTILPGPTRTEGTLAMIEALARDRGIGPTTMEALFLKENRPSGLLGRFAEPAEVAALSVYAASVQASATTGAALRVDGGIVESIA